MKKILIVKFRNIGDVLLTTPLIQNLKRHFNDARIDVALNAGTEAVLRHHPDVRKLHIYDRAAIKSLPLPRRLLAEAAFARGIRREKYDLVINTTEGDRGAQLALISGAKITIGYPPKKNRLLRSAYTHPMPSQERRHTIEANLDALRLLDLSVVDKRVTMAVDEDARQSATDTLRRMGVEGAYVHFHPVSRWLFKCLEDEIAAKIVDFCQRSLNLPVVLTAAPIQEEIEKTASIIAKCQSTPIDLSGRLTLEETAVIAQRAHFFVGVDTAVMHIAAAMDTPVLAFFGPSGAFHWGPWDNSLDESGYIHQNGPQQMGKHRVLQVDWPCAPCGQDGCEGRKISDCLLSKGLSWPLIERTLKEMVA